MKNTYVADGNGVAVQITGGFYQTFLVGNLGGGTLIVQWSGDNGTTWSTITDAISGQSASTTSVGAFNFYAQGGLIRTGLSGSTSPALAAYVGLLYTHNIQGQ